MLRGWAALGPAEASLGNSLRGGGGAAGVSCFPSPPGAREVSCLPPVTPLSCVRAAEREEVRDWETERGI